MAIIVVVDTETTGLGRFHDRGPRPDGVVQVGLAWRHPTRGIQVWERICNPGPKLLEFGRAAEALRISGLTETQVLAAPTSAKVARELHTQLTRIRREQGRIELRAFNVKFDRSFLTLEPWKLKTGWGPCLMVEAARGFGYDSERVGLGRAAELVGVKIEGRPHTAGTDARTALLVHEYFAARIGSRRDQIPTRNTVPPSSDSGWRYRAGCELCESTGPHDGDHGYFQEGEFYSFEGA